MNVSSVGYSAISVAARTIASVQQELLDEASGDKGQTTDPPLQEWAGGKQSEPDTTTTRHLPIELPGNPENKFDAHA